MLGNEGTTARRAFCCTASSISKIRYTISFAFVTRWMHLYCARHNVKIMSKTERPGQFKESTVAAHKEDTMNDPPMTRQATFMSTAISIP